MFQVKALTIELLKPLLLHQDMQHRIMAVAATRVHRHTAGLVDNDHAIVLAHDLDRQVGHGRLVAVDVVGNNVAVLHDVVLRHDLTVDLDPPVADGSFLDQKKKLKGFGRWIEDKGINISLYAVFILLQFFGATAIGVF